MGKEGSGFTYIVNTALDNGRYSIAWGGLAIAQEAVEAMVTYLRNRKQFGKGIFTSQLIQVMIGDEFTNIHAANLRDDKHNDAIMETTIAKYFTSKIANKIASDAAQVGVMDAILCTLLKDCLGKLKY